MTVRPSCLSVPEGREREREREVRLQANSICREDGLLGSPDCDIRKMNNSRPLNTAVFPLGRIHVTDMCASMHLSWKRGRPCSEGDDADADADAADDSDDAADDERVIMFSPLLVSPKFSPVFTKWAETKKTSKWEKTANESTKQEMHRSSSTLGEGNIRACGIYTIPRVTCNQTLLQQELIRGVLYGVICASEKKIYIRRHEDISAPLRVLFLGERPRPSCPDPFARETIPGSIYQELGGR